MFTHAREVICPECRRWNAWKPAAELSEALYCQHCGVFIDTYGDHLRYLIRQEVARIMALYAAPASFANRAAERASLRGNAVQRKALK